MQLYLYDIVFQSAFETIGQLEHQNHCKELCVNNPHQLTNADMYTVIV